MEKSENISNEENTIGNKVTVLRISLNLTQEKFADLMLVGRGSIIKLESIDSIDTISLDIAYRLFYLTNKVMYNPYKEVYIRELAKSINERLDGFLQKRIQATNP